MHNKHFSSLCITKWLKLVSSLRKMVIQIYHYQLTFFVVAFSLILVPLVHCLTFTLNPQDPQLFEVNERFLSVALDSSSIDNRFSEFNLTSVAYFIFFLEYCWYNNF